MRNRIFQPTPQCFPQRVADSGHDSIEPLSAAVSLAGNAASHRPTLCIGDRQSITVDMERFFDFSFSFAEALVDLEDRFGAASCAEAAIDPRKLGARDVASDSDFDTDFEIDARWM